MDVDPSRSKYDVHLRKVGVENKAFSDDNDTKEDGAKKLKQEKVSTFEEYNVGWF